jgi:hypothetical protein
MSFTDEANAMIGKVETAVATALNGVVAESMKGAIAQSVQTEVYAAYTPSMYKRRGTAAGGLENPESNVATVIGMELTVRNETLGNAAYSGSDGWDSGEIADIVEQGNGYHWKRSEIYQQQPFPRPFMQPAKDLYVGSGLAEMDVVDEINKAIK